MARLPRLQAAGATYHVTARGTGPCAIFVDDSDRDSFFVTLASVVSRMAWQLYGYCLMKTHYHLLFETPEANLADGMRRLNSSYATSFNRRHERTGHLFQGRYHAVVIMTESHLLEVLRYIALNPVRAGKCEHPEEWRWGSYSATLDGRSPPFLSLEVLRTFGGDHSEAVAGFRRFVEMATSRAV